MYNAFILTSRQERLNEQSKKILFLQQLHVSQKYNKSIYISKIECGKSSVEDKLYLKRGFLHVKSIVLLQEIELIICDSYSPLKRMEL